MENILTILIILFLPFSIGMVIDLDENSRNKTGSETYPEHIAGAYTGGFGEQSCHSCHFDYELNQPKGELAVSGMKDVYKADNEYTIQIKVQREDMSRAGFQMTARFEDGSQAGQFELNEEVTTTPNIENTIAYLQHAVGEVEAENGEKNWKIRWRAPDQADQPIIFNIAANAANGDASEFGDWIYLKEIKIEPNNE